MKTLTTKGTLLNREGYIIAQGLSAWLFAETLAIGASAHWLEDVQIMEDRIEAKGGAWTLLF